MKFSKSNVGLFVLACCLVKFPVQAGVYSETLRAQAAFAGASAPELPDRAASFIDHHQPGSRADAAVGAMKAAIGINPAASLSVLASIVSAEPSAAPEVTAAAVILLPGQTWALARVAAKNAPAYTSRIAARLAKDPRDRKRIAEAIGESVPSGTQAVAAPTAATSRLAGRIPAMPLDPAKALDDVSFGAPYQSGGVVPLNNSGLRIENANNSSIYPRYYAGGIQGVGP
jgi:hypothetical protein